MEKKEQFGWGMRDDIHDWLLLCGFKFPPPPPPPPSLSLSLSLSAVLPLVALKDFLDTARFVCVCVCAK